MALKEKHSCRCISWILFLEKCNPGFESSDDGKSCIPCPSGYYRESSSDVKCIKCSGDKTTKMYGATKRGQCIGM